MSKFCNQWLVSARFSVILRGFDMHHFFIVKQRNDDNEWKQKLKLKLLKCHGLSKGLTAERWISFTSEKLYQIGILFYFTVNTFFVDVPRFCESWLLLFFKSKGVAFWVIKMHLMPKEESHVIRLFTLLTILDTKEKRKKKKEKKKEKRLELLKYWLILLANGTILAVFYLNERESGEG